MRRLALTMSHRSDEAPHGFLGRVAARNGVDAASFCLHMGLDLLKVANGDGRTIDQLAALTGADAAALRRNALVRVGHQTWTISGEVVEWHMVRRLDARVCPACLAEDVAAWPGLPEEAAYCRTAWLVEQVRTCPTHAVALVELAPDGRGRTRWATHDFVGRLSASPSGSGAPGLPVVKTYVSGLEAYLAGRLAGRRQDEWLDALPFNVVANFTESLGVAALLGASVSFNDLGPDDWKAAGDAGWEVMRRGERGMAEFASAMARWTKHGPEAGDGLRASFGKFWEFVLRASRKPDYHPVCVAFASQLGDLRPALPSRLVPDGVTPGRRGYRLSTAATEHRRSPGTLRRLLASRGVLGPEHDGLSPRSVILDPEIVGAALGDLKRRISLAQAGQYLNAPNRQAELLYSAGFLGDVASARMRGVNLTVDRADLEAFLEDLVKGTVECGESNADQGTLVQAAHSAKRSLAEVTRLVLDRRLGWVGLRSGSRGFSSVVVRLAEVRRILNGTAPRRLTKMEASRILRIEYGGVTALVADGHLSTEPVRQGRNGVPYDVVTAASLDAFRQTYASVSCVASLWGVHFNAARARLDARGIRPVLSVERYGTPIYRFVDVPPLPFDRARSSRSLPTSRAKRAKRQVSEGDLREAVPRGATSTS